MLKNQRGIATTEIIGIITALAVVAIAVGVWLHTRSQDKPLAFDTPYQAVLLSNGSVYFGKLEGFGTKSPILRDVYYVQSATDPQTKKVTNVLIKRGKELHAPDRMYINPNQILLVEPVGPSSKVAELIQESKTKGQ